MPSLVKIPYVDIRGHTPVELLYLYKGKARALVKAALSSFGAPSRLAGAAFLPLSDRATKLWLEKNANPYLGEIAWIDSTLRVPGVFTFNTCLEWGCTTGVWQDKDGLVLRRVMDWPFPTLGENIIVAHQSGPAGAFFNLTWPGFCGVFQALAPGRFAAAVNQAPMRRLKAGLAGDWVTGRLIAGYAKALPPTHLLRQVFETAPDFAAAKAKLCTTPLAVPAIFTLAGMKGGEGCIIERTETEYALREMTGGHVCAANHFETPPDGKLDGWRARPIDSYGRIGSAYALKDEEPEFSWFLPPIANSNSRLALEARLASDGTLALMGTLGAVPVTEVFRLPLAV